MISESELRRENEALQSARDLLVLRQENRELKRQIKRLEAGKPVVAALSGFQWFTLVIYGVSLISLGALLGIVIGDLAGTGLERLLTS